MLHEFYVIYIYIWNEINVGWPKLEQKTKVFLCKSLCYTANQKHKENYIHQMMINNK